MRSCIFCQIAAGEISAKKIIENADFMVIKDIDPKAKIHYLIIPKKHILQAEINDCQPIFGQIFQIANTLEKELELKNGYRLTINKGSDAGQEIDHLHIHFLAGQKMKLVD